MSTHDKELGVLSPDLKQVLLRLMLLSLGTPAGSVNENLCKSMCCGQDGLSRNIGLGTLFMKEHEPIQLAKPES